LNIKAKLGIVSAVAAVLIGFAVFGLGSTEVKADVRAGNVWIVPQHAVVGPTCGTATVGADATTGAWQVNTTNFPPAVSSFFLNTGTTTANPTGLPLVEINNLSAASSILNTTNPTFINQSFIYICVNTTSATPGVNTGGSINYNTGSVASATADDDSITFSAIVQANMGFFDQPSCSDRNGNGVFGEAATFPLGDACTFPSGGTASAVAGGTAELEIPGAPINNVNTVIVRFSCSQLVGFATGPVMPITIQQDQGAFTFNVICKGSAAAAGTTISATPNTVEIIPARSNTSHSLILMKIVDANGSPIFPGTDVQFTVSGPTNCTIESAGLGTGTSAITTINGIQATNTPILGTLADGPGTLSLGAAIPMTSALNTAAPGTYLTWEFSAPASVPTDVLGSFAPFGTFALTPFADITKAIDGFDLNSNGIPDASLAGAILNCNPLQASSPTPGVATIQGCVAVLNAVDVCATTTVKVIGPPASVTVSASPTSVNCGEKSTVTATVVDSIGQNVSDHTRVEFVTNIGGVIGGTGAVAGFASNTAPVSNSVADTFGGVATAFLLTSSVNQGPYEVVATTGGTTSGDFSFQNFPFGAELQSIDGSNISPFGLEIQPFNTFANLTGTPIANIGEFSTFSYLTRLGGQFSTPAVSAQVTVNCGAPAAAAAPAVPAPIVQAPRTGTGIVPPNTGDAGLARSSSASLTLFAFGGLVALTFAGLAAVKAVRR